MSEIIRPFLSQCIDANKCSPLKNNPVSVVLETEKDNTRRYFIVRYGAIHNGKWDWDVSIKDIPLDVYQCLRAKETKVIGWRDMITSLPRCIELTKGKAAVYW